MRVPWAWRARCGVLRGGASPPPPPHPASSEQPRGHRAGPGHARAPAARPGPRACPGSTAREAAPPLRPRVPAPCRGLGVGSVASPRSLLLSQVVQTWSRCPSQLSEKAPEVRGQGTAHRHRRPTARPPPRGRLGAPRRWARGSGAARRGPAAVCAQNPVTSAASCGSATVTALKCARSTETRPCGDAPRRGRLLLPSAAALPLGPLRRARPTWQPSALGGPGRRRGCGVRSAPRGGPHRAQELLSGKRPPGVPGPTPPPRGACAQAAGAGCAVRM